jgi:hypothetical protein
MSEMNLYLGLVHHPIKNKNGEIVTTSVTNLDIHDISRSCRTFSVNNYFIISPLQAQKELVNRILGHWETDEASLYNPDRKDALSIARMVPSIDEAVSRIEQAEKRPPMIVVTGANFDEYGGDEAALKKQWEIDKPPILLLFGTGWGLASPIVEEADFKLTPIWSKANDGYNHLSVRSAVAIYLDRIMNIFH